MRAEQKGQGTVPEAEPELITLAKRAILFQKLKKLGFTSVTTTNSSKGMTIVIVRPLYAASFARVFTAFRKAGYDPRKFTNMSTAKAVACGHPVILDFQDIERGVFDL